MKSLIIISLLISSSLHAAVSANVLRVIDGDTLVVIRRGASETIRLIGINAPEIKHRNQIFGRTSSDECFGPEATVAAREIAEGREVRLVRKGKDRFGRTLAYVYVLGQDESLNRYLIRLGFARAERRFPHTAMRSYVALEAKAKALTYLTHPRRQERIPAKCAGASCTGDAP